MMRAPDGRRPADAGRKPGGAAWWQLGLAAGLGMLVGAAAVLVYLASVSGDRSVAASIPPQAPELRIMLSERLLSALVSQSLATTAQPISLKNVRVETGQKTLSVYGDASVLGGSVSGKVVFDPKVENGELKLEVIEAQVGRVPLHPHLLRSQVKQMVDQRIRAVLQGLPASVSSVEVTSEGLIVTAVVDVNQIRFPIVDNAAPGGTEEIVMQIHITTKLVF